MGGVGLRLGSLLVAGAVFHPAVGQDLGILSLDVDVRNPPIAVAANDGWLLSYEIHLTNVGSTGELTILGVEVLSRDTFAEIRGEELEKSTRKAGPTGGPTNVLPPGLRAIVRLAALVEEVPKTVRHRVYVSDPSLKGEQVVECCEVRPVRNRLRLSPPVRGVRWQAVNGPGQSSHHSLSIIPTRGRLSVPQRFAIDWVQVFEDGSWFLGDQGSNESFHAYGAEVLAVAPARVVAVTDGIPENSPHPTKRAVKMDINTVSGNTVVLDLGEGRFAFYAHLQPGSIRVAKGDSVRRGQVLGLLGNSGNSTAPHLHFHVSDGRRALEGEGLPYVIDEFRKENRRFRDKLPLDGWVVDF